MANEIAIIGKNLDGSRLLIAAQRAEYRSDTPVAIWTSPDEWDSMRGKLTLGMAYKFGIWDDPTSDLVLPKGMPAKTRKYLLGEL